MIALCPLVICNPRRIKNGSLTTELTKIYCLLAYKSFKIDISAIFDRLKSREIGRRTSTVRGGEAGGEGFVVVITYCRAERPLMGAVFQFSRGID